MNKFFLIIWLTVLAGGVLFGQDKKGRSVSVNLYAFAYAEGHETVYLANKKKEPVKIRLSNANILGPFKTSLNDNDQVMIRTKRVNDEGTTIYPAIALAKIPSHITKPLLILVPITGKFSYQALVIDQNVANFPKGSYKLVNFSPSEIRGLVGQTKVAVASKKIISFDPSSNKGDLLDVHFKYKRPKDWKTFGRTRWSKDNEKRCLLCAYLNPTTKRMRIRGIDLQKIPKEP